MGPAVVRYRAAANSTLWRGNGPRNHLCLPACRNPAGSRLYASIPQSPDRAGRFAKGSATATVSIAPLGGSQVEGDFPDLGPALQVHVQLGWEDLARLSHRLAREAWPHDIALHSTTAPPGVTKRFIYRLKGTILPQGQNRLRTRTAPSKAEREMLELYYYENSICAERVLMTLAEKNINDWVPHHLHLFKGEHFTSEYLKLNPKGVVPTLVHDGHVIRESAIICDYVDDLSSDRPLKPTHPAERARMREWVKDSDDYIFEAVGSLSFSSVFRARMLQMSPKQRADHWRNQKVLDRALRQISCVEHGLDSPYAIRAIASWDRTWGYIEEALGDGRPWLMGDQFTLAEICYAPFLARIAGLEILDVWLTNRPLGRAWWRRIRERPSFIKADVGPSAAERDAYAQEGRKVAAGVVERLELIRAGRALELATRNAGGVGQDVGKWAPT